VAPETIARAIALFCFLAVLSLGFAVLGWILAL
jgi:hypothetical protein